MRAQKYLFANVFALLCNALHYVLRQDASIQVEPLSSTQMTPLGSVWKLFVYFYLTENQIRPPSYICKGDNKEELFCCRPKGHIDLDAALTKSCGLYFSPERLEISKDTWRSFWTDRIKLSYPWLTALDQLAPATQVPVEELLQALAQLKSYASSFEKINNTLAQVTIDGTASGSVRELGSTLRVKTFTWDNSGPNDKFVGGFAGWTGDSSALWAQGHGTSRQVLTRWSKQIAALTETHSPSTSRDCVDVSFFDRYPVRSIQDLATGREIKEGTLTGRFRISFANGQSVDIESLGELHAHQDSAIRLRITGRFSLAEYGARVLDREVSPTPLEAGRAFSILIRTYLYQNGRSENGCYAIKDSTHLQRVSPSTPSDAALKIATWSDRLILKGIPIIRYHSDTGTTNKLSWKQAAGLAANGSRFDEILRTTYPASQLAMMDDRDHAPCKPQPNADAYLQHHRRTWSRALAQVQGFQEPDRIKICRSMSDQPYTDRESNTIYLRFSGEIDDQLTIAHEFLHIAFKYHPSGSNEGFVEKHARDLVFNSGQEGAYETK